MNNEFFEYPEEDIIDEETNEDFLHDEYMENKVQKDLEDMTDKLYDFWKNWIIDFDIDYYKALRNEIYFNLQSKEGIEKELDCLRIEFEVIKCRKTSKAEKEMLQDIWDELNYYKTRSGFSENI